MSEAAAFQEDFAATPEYVEGRGLVAYAVVPTRIQGSCNVSFCLSYQRPHSPVSRCSGSG